MLKPGTLKVFGVTALLITTTLVVFVFLVPYLILKQISSGLQKTYQLDPTNTHIWESMPGGKEIVYKKLFRFYNISSDNYYQITNITLHEAFNLTIEKETKLLDLKFEDSRVSAVLNTTYRLPDDLKSTDILSRDLLQFRHGAFRAIAEIERRPPTYYTTNTATCFRHWSTRCWRTAVAAYC